ncbi:DENN domain and WD repeat-containing protein SCD1 [Phytophthora citrophthora]|uniref:DENN domain and WD repeat-containing protein SCD1 n=1 Tax=Phytophthora citrophthora TaxID=4793 RepID=A0AAD9LRL3_9STRA|nr:DENN domain and WD repeat-containing protein SCD1 [Phytophthora citrophthora]
MADTTSKLLQSSETVVRPVTNLGRVDQSQPVKHGLVLQSGAAFFAPGIVANAATAPSTPSGSRWSSSSLLEAKHSSTLSVLSAAAASLKDKTQQVAQQQKRALSAFQQKGGLVSWLHGEMEEADERSTKPATEHNSPVTYFTDSGGLCTPPSPCSPSSESTIPKPVERRRSLPNIGSGSPFDNWIDKVVAVTSPTAQPTSPPLSPQPRTTLQPTVATVSETKSPSSPDSGRLRAVSDSPIRVNTAAVPTFENSRSGASISTSRFSLDEVLSDEWSCTVLWAFLYSTATGRDQHHHRLSFLIETTFQITPLYRKLAGSGELTSESESKFKLLVTRLKRLHSRFLVHNGGVPAASSGTIHAKNILAVAVHTLTTRRLSKSELTTDVQVENTISALFQLAREVEKEFRVIGTRSYANFADSSLYRDFIVHQSGTKSITALLRAARIPFYQQPNVMDPICLDTLVSEDPSAVFSRANCQVFVVTAQLDGSIKFTDISPGSSDNFPAQTQLQPFLNPSGNIFPTERPLAFNFTAGTGATLVYGAVMWLPVSQSSALGTEESPSGLCIISKAPLVDSLRHFLSAMWKQISDNTSTNDSDATLLAPAQVLSASLAMGSHFLSLQPDSPQENDPLPLLDIRLDDLFDSLSLMNVLRLFAFALLEKKIVLVASSYSILFSVSEALRALLYPLVWSHVYVPVLPLALKDCLHCPTPFIFGLHDSYVRRSDMPRPSNDLVVVNLDRDSLTGGGEIVLPPGRYSMMREELFRLCKPQWSSRDSVDNFEASSSFFPAISIRRVFYKHLREILTSLESCVNRFELNGQSVSVVDNANTSQWPAEASRFCSAMLHTQAVSIYLASPRCDEQEKVNRIFI